MNVAEMTYEDLIAAVNEADRLYYDDPDNATLPDSEYDVMYDELLRYEAVNTPSPDSPTQRVQGSSTFAPTRHAVPMMSLEKVTTTEQLAAFVARVGEGTAYSVEPKLDGASLSLEYENGRLVRAVTRGDGTTGDEVTANAVRIYGVPFTLLDEHSDFTGWVRGEVVINRDDFERINADGKFANTRNAAAGALRHSDPYEARRRGLRFYAYDASDGHAHNALLFLQYQFAVAKGADVAATVERFITLRDQDKFPFDTDGIVIKAIGEDVRAQQGSTGKHPKWAVAFKTQGEVGTTTLKAVTWQVGANGAVTPVAELEPVHVAGTTISRATLHNPKFIKDKDICVNDQVEITRAGDVIPYVMRVVERAYRRSVVSIPQDCPDCGSPLTQEGNSGQIQCRSSQCPAQVAGRLVKWAGRDAADIDAIGPKWIELFVEAGLLRDAADFYRLTHADLDGFENMGEKRAQQFLDSIEDSADLGMRRALIGFSIPFASEGTAKRLCYRFESVEEVAQATASQLSVIDDIGVKVAESIVAFFNAHPYICSDLREQDVNLDRKSEDAPVDTSAGHAFCVTGSIPGFKSRKDFIAALEQKGWTSQSGVSKNTEFLILEDPDSTSSKAKKARSLDIPIITPAEAAAKAGLA